MKDVPEGYAVNWGLEFCGGQLGVLYRPSHRFGSVYDDAGLPLLLRRQSTVTKVTEFSQLADECLRTGVSMRQETMPRLRLFCHVLLTLYGSGRVLHGELGHHERSKYAPELTGPIDPSWDAESLEFYAEQQLSNNETLTLVRYRMCATSGTVDVAVLGER